MPAVICLPRNGDHGDLFHLGDLTGAQTPIAIAMSESVVIPLVAKQDFPEDETWVIGRRRTKGDNVGSRIGQGLL